MIIHGYSEIELKKLPDLQQSSEIDNLIDRLKKQDTPKSICKNTNTW